MSNVGKGKKGSAIVLADIQHLGKVDEAALLAALGEDDSITKQIRAERTARTRKGSFLRRVFRRNKRRLSSLDLRVAQETGKPLYSHGKNVKRLQARFVRYLKQTRLITGLLIRATGAAAPSLIAQNDYVMPAYQRRIAENGTSISKPNLRGEHADI